MKLDTWQEEVLAYDGDILLCTGRRVGKTQIMAIKASEYMIANPKHQIIVASLTEDQAQLIIMMALNYLEKHYPKQISKKKVDSTKRKILLKNGSQLLARPVGNTGDAIRGFNANILILDEVSRFNKLIMEAATPTLLTTGGQIWMCSTPFGKQGYFWKRFDEAYNKKDKDARFKVFYKTSEDVIHNRPISESWKEETRRKAIINLEKEKLEKSDLEYGQEYMGLFMEDLMRILTDEEIDAVCTIQREQREVIVRGRDYYGGGDIARLGDDTTVLDACRRTSNNHLIQVYHEVGRKWFVDQTEDRIVELHQSFRFLKFYLDAGSGSLGVGILDHLQRKRGMEREAVASNNRSIVQNRDGTEKQHLKGVDMYLNLITLIKRKQITLFDIEEIKLSLRSLQMEYVKKEGQPTQLRIFSPMHSESDIAEALKRMAECSKEKHINKLLYSFSV